MGNALLTLSIVLCLETAPSEHRDMLDYLLQGNQAQRAKYPFISARITYTRAYADSVAEAFAGKYRAEPTLVVCQVNWAQLGDKVRYDEVFDAETLRRGEKTQGDVSIRSHATFLSVRDGRTEAAYEPGQTFNTGHDSTAGMGYTTPFSLHYRQSIRERADYLKRQFNGTVRYLEERELEGKRYPVIEYYFKAGTGDQREHRWIDVRRGFWPIRTESFVNGKLADIVVVSEVRDLGQGRWLPTAYRVVEPNPRSLVHNAIYVYDFQVQAFDVDQPPPASTFVLQVPPGKAGFSRADMRPIQAKTGRIDLSHLQADGTPAPGQNEIVAFRPKGRQNADPNNSPLLPLVAPAKSTVPRWPFDRGTPSPWSSGWLLLAAAAVLMATVAVLYRRRNS